MMTSAEALLYHLANRYLRPLLPSKILDELHDRFVTAELVVNNPAMLAVRKILALELSGRDLSPRLLNRYF